MSVVDFAAAKRDRTPSWEGPCICLHCRHEWTGVGEMGVVSGLECPSCGLGKGVTKWPFASKPGDMVLMCNCGCEAMTAYKRAVDRLLVVRCMNCGADQTDTFFGD